jgi:hypothetical protein
MLREREKRGRGGGGEVSRLTFHSCSALSVVGVDLFLPLPFALPISLPLCVHTCVSGAMDPILYKDNLEGIIKRDTMLVDISVPRNVDDKVSAIASERQGGVRGKTNKGREVDWRARVGEGVDGERAEAIWCDVMRMPCMRLHVKHALCFNLHARMRRHESVPPTYARNLKPANEHAHARTCTWPHERAFTRMYARW